MADLAVAGASRHAEGPGAESLGSAPRRSLKPFAALAAALAAEDGRRILWIPVFFGTGIALYFTLTIEPPLWIGITLTLGAAAIALGLRRWPALYAIAIVLAVVAAGFAVMQAARWERGTAMLERRLGPVAMTGTVVDIDALERGWRIIVAPDPLPGLAADAQPHRLRIPGGEPNSLQRIEIGRVGHRQRQTLLRLRQRQDLRASDKVGAELVRMERGRRIICLARQRDRQKLGEGFGHLALVDHAEAGDDEAFTLAALAAQCAHPVALHLIDPSAADQEIDEIHARLSADPKRHATQELSGASRDVAQALIAKA